MKYAQAARGYIIFITVTGFASAAMIIAQDILIAHGAAQVITHHTPLSSIATVLAILAVVVALRAGLMLLRQWYAHRAATQAIAQLRQSVLQHAAKLGPRWNTEHAADTVTTVTRGLADLEPYFVNYLPQLLLSMTVTPFTLAVMLYLDWPSALFALAAIPLIPIFMILIGKLTQEYSERRLATMQQMGRQVMDLIAGLTTLKALGREQGPAQQVEKVGRKYTASTMSTLRIAFMSGGALEFITTLSVALVAVEVGWRMMDGNMDLFSGLIVIMLAPEVFDPLRQVGKQFHASTDGIVAANAAFRILETPLPPAGRRSAPDLRNCEIELRDLSVMARGTWAPHNLHGRIAPGQINALCGPSGVGKTTTALVLLGLLPADCGQVLVQGVDLAQIERESWWRQISWVPQHPTITPGTILENLAPGQNLSAPTEALRQAAAQTGFDRVVDTAPAGWQTRIGQGGVGLSVGQRQRLALTRALAEERPLVVLDEPTAHLDANLEAQVLSALRQMRQQGRTVVVIAHRQALIDLADQRLELQTAPLSPAELAQAAASAAADAETAAAGRGRRGARRRVRSGDKTGRSAAPAESLPPLILDLDSMLEADAK